MLAWEAAGFQWRVLEVPGLRLPSPELSRREQEFVPVATESLIRAATTSSSPCETRSRRDSPSSFRYGLAIMCSPLGESFETVCSTHPLVAAALGRHRIGEWLIPGPDVICGVGAAGETGYRRCSRRYAWDLRTAAPDPGDGRPHR